MTETDFLLVKKCQSGDKSAYDKLVHRYKKQIYQLAFHMCGSHTISNDISQETFIQSYKSIGKFKGKSNFSTWLQKITINVSINHLKKEMRFKHKPLDEQILDNKNSPNITVKINNPIENIEARELNQQIKAAVDSLPLNERAVFTLRNHYGLTYKEIAISLDCPKGTVMSLLNSARRKLRDKLSNYII
jgi:RNA polymerase sigma-70 factor (ECF subfamily)